VAGNPCASLGAPPAKLPLRRHRSELKTFGFRYLSGNVEINRDADGPVEWKVGIFGKGFHDEFENGFLAIFEVFGKVRRVTVDFRANSR